MRFGFIFAFYSYFFVFRVILVVVHPLLIPKTPRPQQAANIGSGSRRGHSPYINDISSTGWKRSLLVTLQQRQQKPIVSLLRMSIALTSQSMLPKATAATTRRNWIKNGVALFTTQQLLLNSQVASAKPDCYTDCYKNCIALAPKDNVYCSESCTDYCLQDDRQDGLSGSVSSDKGEVGILGGSFGTGTVVKGQDKPPVLGKIPGLDFTSGYGKKMIGY